MRALLAAINCQKGDIERNFATHADAVAEAVAERCDIAVFPEMSLTGYLNPERADHVPISVESEPVRRMCELSAETGIDLLFGIVEANPTGLPFIAQVSASSGQIEAVYRKRHLGEGEPGLFTAGADAGAESVVTGKADDRFGIAVCADYEVPDEFEYAARNGARTVFHPSAPGLWGRRTDEASWRNGFDWWRGSCIENHGQRAKELGISIAVVTQAGVTEDEDFPGWAAVIGPDGRVKTELPDWHAANLVVDL